MSKPTCDCPERPAPMHGYYTCTETVCKGCPDLETCKVYQQHEWLYPRRGLPPDQYGEPMSWKVFLVGTIVAAIGAAVVSFFFFS